MTRFAVTHHGTVTALFPTFGDALDHLRSFHPQAVFDLVGATCPHGFSVQAVTV